jgi:AraC family transcriptional regulator
MFGVPPSRFRSLNRPPKPIAAPLGLHYREGAVAAHFRAAQPGAKKVEVKIEIRKPVRVAFMRHVGPYSEVGQTWDKLLPALGKEGFLGGDAQFIGICHDDPEVTPPDKIRYDACVTVDESFVPEGDAGVQVVPGGTYARTTHFGPYQKLGETYARLLGQWLPRSGYELRSSPCFEVYLTDPQSVEPEDLVTDVYAPLER